MSSVRSTADSKLTSTAGPKASTAAEESAVVTIEAAAVAAMTMLTTDQRYKSVLNMKCMTSN